MAEPLESRQMLTSISLVPVLTLPTNTEPSVIQTADMDGDLDLDFVVARWAGTRNNSDPGVSWFENETTAAKLSFSEHPIKQESAVTFVADVNGDGNVDVFVRDPDSSGAEVFENKDGFEQSQPTSPDSLSFFGVQTLADMDNDGDADFIEAARGFLGGGGELNWLENDGVGNAVTRHVIAAGGSPNLVEAADIDGDGDLDVIASFISDTPGETMAWFEQTPNGFEGHALSLFVPGIWDIVVSDFDADGDNDIVTARGDGVFFHENTGGTIAFGTQLDKSALSIGGRPMLTSLRQLLQ